MGLGDGWGFRPPPPCSSSLGSPPASDPRGEVSSPAVLCPGPKMGLLYPQVHMSSAAPSFAPATLSLFTLGSSFLFFPLLSPPTPLRSPLVPLPPPPVPSPTPPLPRPSVLSYLILHFLSSLPLLALPTPSTLGVVNMADSNNARCGLLVYVVILLDKTGVSSPVRICLIDFAIFPTRVTPLIRPSLPNRIFMLCWLCLSSCPQPRISRLMPSATNGNGPPGQIPQRSGTYRNSRDAIFGNVVTELVKVVRNTNVKKDGLPKSQYPTD